MKNLLLLSLVSLLVACGEESTILPISDQIAGQPTSVQFVTNVENKNIADLHIEYFPKYQPTAAIDITSALKHDPNNPDLYLAELPTLLPDVYRVRMRMVFYERIAGMRLIRYTHDYTRDFQIYAPLSRDCFRFDDKQRGTMGWATTPVFLDAREKPVSDSGCHGLFYADQSWPVALTETSSGGSLFIPVSNKCFPSTSSNTLQPGNWHFTVSSPPLGSLPAWQNIKAVQLRVATKSINVDVRPEIIFQGGLPVETPATTPIRYPSYRGTWRVIDHPVTMPKGAVVTQLRLHIAGVPEETVKDTVDAILIDGICPIK